MTEKSSNIDFISIGELFRKMKSTDLYINSTKEEKKKISLNSLIEFFSSNKKTKNNFKDIHRPYIDGIQKKYTNVLLGYKFITLEDMK